MDFVRHQGVVGLAVGLAIGVQVQATTKSIADGFITPIVNFLLSFIMKNPTDLGQQKWQVAGPPHLLVIAWGSILVFLIELLAVAAVIYFVVHGLKLDRIDLKDEKK